METATLIHLTLKPGQIPALVGLVLVNIALVIAATLIIDRMTHPEPNGLDTAATATAPSLAAISSEVAELFPTLEITIIPSPAGPTPTPPPNPLTLGGTFFYAYRQNGYTNLWSQALGQPNPVRLTAGPWDDRDPAASPDGTHLAFASRRGGSWNIYVMDLSTGGVKAVTTGPDFKGNPNWSPDGRYLVFEIYQNNNLDINVISLDGTEVIPLTTDPAADYEPSWSPSGRDIVWVSMRSGNPDLWYRSLDEPLESSARQLTNSPRIYESEPDFSPNGQLVVYADAASSLGLVYALFIQNPENGAWEAGQGQHPVWSPDGSSLLTIAPQENGADYLLAAPFGQYGLGQIAYKSPGGRIHSIDWTAGLLPEALPQSIRQANQVADAPLWSESISDPQSGDPPYALVTLPDVTAPDPRLSDRVDESFTGLRRTTAQAVGWDFLGILDNALVPLKAPPPPSLDYNSWLKTGRAFDFAQATAQAGWVVVTREDYGIRTYWRVWVRAVRQDGSLGEPLRRPPWNFEARYSGRPGPYDAGGEYFPILPAGYFVDFTTLAEDFGWSRVPAQANWTAFYPGILFWRFEQHPQLDWLVALREVYTAAQAATQTPVPSPTPTPSITATPSETLSPTPSETYTPSITPTRSPSRTRRPSITPTLTYTRRPTRTLTPTNTPRPSRTPR